MRCTIDDLDRVARVMMDDQVRPWISDDGCQGRVEDRIPEMLQFPGVYILMPNEDCVFMGFPFNGISGHVHACVHPEGRGKTAVEATKRAIEWTFENTQYRSLFSFVPALFKHSLVFSLQCGMTERGVIPQSYQLYGIIYDQHILSIERDNHVR